MWKAYRKKLGQALITYLNDLYQTKGSWWQTIVDGIDLSTMWKMLRKKVIGRGNSPENKIKFREAYVLPDTGKQNRLI